jgi:formylglycine-generating enzyme required for sulfatase activity
MGFCVECGAQLGEGDEFCPGCGTRVEGVTASSTTGPEQAAALPSNLQYLAALDGKQAGPFGAEELKNLIKQGKFNRETLVWKAGMANWTAAGQVADLALVFAPPPPPKAPAAPPKPPKPPRVNVPKGFIEIKGGKFTMGSPEYEGDREKNGNNETPHQVTLDGFYLAEHAVTVEDFKKFVEATGYATIAEREGTGGIFVNKKMTDTKGVTWKSAHFQNSQKQAANHPVVVLAFEDCAMYCNWRSDSENYDRAYTIAKGNVSWNRDANGYRLPTEAEWEYACRAGTKVSFSTGGVITDKQAKFGGVEGCTVPVNSFDPNGWGLYCMHGNVFEWCWDFYAPYPESAISNPTGPATGTERVCRGGSWCSAAGNLRSACRVKHEPGFRSYHTGFRLALNG